eukprot:TRINITY_DN371_c0_g1_i1.p1 TRINITY_DN371_c0_g1~~TRINITY_DN371_c0_g1_i1.p1  ORF type:complete len:377 (+),score=84.59 TRINITY_DN371_c0_g1_i1:10-1140(+)
MLRGAVGSWVFIFVVYYLIHSSFCRPPIELLRCVNGASLDNANGDRTCIGTFLKGEVSIRQEGGSIFTAVLEQDNSSSPLPLQLTVSGSQKSEKTWIVINLDNMMNNSIVCKKSLLYPGCFGEHLTTDDEDESINDFVFQVYGSFFNLKRAPSITLTAIYTDETFNVWRGQMKNNTRIELVRDAITPLSSRFVRDISISITLHKESISKVFLQVYQQFLSNAPQSPSSPPTSSPSTPPQSPSTPPQSPSTPPQSPSTPPQSPSTPPQPSSIVVNETIINGTIANGTVVVVNGTLTNGTSTNTTTNGAVTETTTTISGSTAADDNSTVYLVVFVLLFFVLVVILVMVRDWYIRRLASQPRPVNRGSVSLSSSVDEEF